MERRSLLLAVGPPDELGEPIGRHDAVRLDRQKRQDEALAGPAEVDLASLMLRPQTAEHP